MNEIEDFMRILSGVVLAAVIFFTAGAGLFKELDYHPFTKITRPRVLAAERRPANRQTAARDENANPKASVFSTGRVSLATGR